MRHVRLLLLFAAAAALEAKPNIVLIVADDLGHAESSAGGPARFADAQHRLAFAENGVRFTNGQA
ncbi:MAG: hypothetical protein R2748_32925 [Bryobacterales bacterium]